MAGDHRLEDVGVADLLHAAHRLLALHAVDHGLHRGVSGTVIFRKGVLNLADRAPSAIPEGFHHCEFEFAQPGLCHRFLSFYYMCRYTPTTYVVCQAKMTP